MGSLPILIFVVFLVAISALGAFLDMLAKMAARAEQERRARARDEQARLQPAQQPQVVAPRPVAPRPVAPRPVVAPPRPVARQVAPQPRQATPVRPAPTAPTAPGSLATRHLTGGLAEHHLAPTASVFGSGKHAAAIVAAPKGPQGLAMLDALPPLARAVVLAELLGKPLASRPRQLHRTRAV